MAILRFFVKTTSNKVESYLDALSRAMNGDLRSIKRKIGATYLAVVHDRIDKEKGPDGKRWKPLSAWTRSAKRDGVRSGWPQERLIREKSIMNPEKIMVWSGKLVASLDARIEGSEIWIGTRGVPYARTMQFGAKKGQFKTWTSKPFLLELNPFDAERLGRSHAWVPSRTSHSPWADIPARPYLGFDQKANESVKKLLIRELIKTNPESLLPK